MRDLPIKTKAEFTDEYQLLRWGSALASRLTAHALWNGCRPILSSENPQSHTFALDKEIVDARPNLRCRAMLIDV